MERINQAAPLRQQCLELVDPLALHLEAVFGLLRSLSLGGKPTLNVFDLRPQRGDRAFQRPQCLPIIIPVVRRSRAGNFPDNLLDDTPDVRRGWLGLAPLRRQLVEWRSIFSARWRSETRELFASASSCSARSARLRSDSSR
jgi:hypothetical protein